MNMPKHHLAMENVVLHPPFQWNSGILIPVIIFKKSFSIASFSCQPQSQPDWYWLLLEEKKEVPVDQGHQGQGQGPATAPLLPAMRQMLNVT